MKKTMLAAALVLAAGAATAAGPTRQGAVINLDQSKLSNAEFKALPDGQALVFKGQSLTAGEARRKMKLVNDQAVALIKSAPQKHAKIDAARKAFLSTHASALDSRNAQGLAAYEQRFHAASTTAPILKR